ncbi:protein kinase 2B, chloroplastic-like [Gossypium australe]|uniref:Protein kinase 2B, chloroplastic-like n=1 Tax=Gossypium australe TaxID=47621 RepID=A0A5B6WMG9_9ROSI|nr:protein kinase 2B, chloroplastic-like [Gossypium australe]
MDEDIEVPTILGQPLLATARTIIDVGNGELVLRVGDEKFSLQARDFVRVPTEQNDVNCSTKVSNNAVQRSLQGITNENMLELYFIESDRTLGTSEEQMVQLDELDE